MNKAKHTPRPCRACVELEHSVGILMLCPLHKAAPDLLAAAKVALSVLEVVEPDTDADVDWAMQETRQAIAKAEGRE